MKYIHLLFPQGMEKAVTFSYDDGCRDDLTTAKVLHSYGLKGTFNLTAIENQNKLTVKEVKEGIIDLGHEIAVHGAQHRAPGVQRPVEGIRDVLDCRLYLEENYDMIIRGMAYPDAGIRTISVDTSYDTIKSYLTDLGIVYARTLGQYGNTFNLPQDWHAWMPTAHHNTPELMEYIDEFIEYSHANVRNTSTIVPKLLYIWGHSYEFPRDNNWDRLDSICAKLAHRDDIWYATNIEIYDYVEAYKSLVFSANGKKVYNPTLYKIWFSVDRKVYSIESGQTLDINE